MMRRAQRRRQPQWVCLTSREAIQPPDLVGEVFIGGSNKATVLRAVTENYLRRSGATFLSRNT
jgi:hypothetical protein